MLAALSMWYAAARYPCRGLTGGCCVRRRLKRGNVTYSYLVVFNKRYSMVVSVAIRGDVVSYVGVTCYICGAIPCRMYLVS